MFNYARQLRWIPLHLAAMAISYGFIELGFWQWERRFRVLADGSQIADWQNTFYAIQWWFFALFMVWFWWKFLTDGYKIEQKAEKS